MSLTNKSILSMFTSAFKDSIDTLPPRGAITIHQKSLFLIWLASTLLWIYKLIENRDCKESKTDQLLVDPTSTNDVKIKIEAPPLQQPQKPPAITFREALFAVFSVGCIMIYYFLCDYLHYFPIAARTYNRDLFVFLCLSLFAIAMYYTSKELPKPGKLLNREQTEEWKGWMQVMFVWYHYFRAAETYNAIRIYIAAYVFMTGFGNFSFFWMRNDYSLRRLLKMLFRLNFLVIITAMVINNEYMLYYICPMHTFWFLSVYLMMRPFNQHNQNKKIMMTKFLIYFGIVFTLYDIPGVAEIVYAPFSFVLNYKNSLHEWIFRSKLDHYATFVGMIFAYNHPTLEIILNNIETHRFKKFFNLGITSVVLAVIAVWYKYVFVLSKYDYNKVHPYTSFIPILSYICLRNMTAFLRNRYMFLFTVLGKITLETYISQLHVYLQADAKQLLVYIPNYPLINFIINTGIYLYLSNLLFNSTITLNEYLFPSDMKKLSKNIVSCIVLFLASYALVFFSTLAA